MPGAGLRYYTKAPRVLIAWAMPCPSLGLLECGYLGLLWRGRGEAICDGGGFLHMALNDLRRNA